MLKRFSICILILALTVVFTGCSSKESSIKINANSKFDEMFGSKPKLARTNAPNIVYMGDSSQSDNEGSSSDMSFDFKDLKR